jgi:hypothetical protein
VHDAVRHQKGTSPSVQASQPTGSTSAGGVASHFSQHFFTSDQKAQLQHARGSADGGTIGGSVAETTRVNFPSRCVRIASGVRRSSMCSSASSTVAGGGSVERSFHHCSAFARGEARVLKADPLARDQPIAAR